MKGVPTFPQCGFSASAVRILQALGVKEFFSVDVLTNQGSNNVSVIDTATNAVVATVAVGSFPDAFGLFIGPAPVVATTAIPTLSEWGVMLLAGMLGLFGMGVMQRRSEMGR